MASFLKKNKGVTIVEIIIAMAILGILSLPVGTMLLNSLITVKLTNERIELNAISRLVKETVTDSFKYGSGTNKIPSSNPSTPFVNLKNGGTYVSGYKLKIIDNNGIENAKYMFNAILYEPPVPVEVTDPFAEVRQYRIEIFKIPDDLNPVQTFYINVNSLD